MTRDLDFVGRKALRLLAEGKVGEPHLRGDVYVMVVRGDTTSHVVTIAPHEDGHDCTDCKAWKHNRRCSHVLAGEAQVELWKEKNGSLD